MVYGVCTSVCLCIFAPLPPSPCIKVLESLQPAELRNARYAMFGQCVMDLIGVLLVLMRYPEDVDQLSEDEVRGGVSP